MKDDFPKVQVFMFDDGPKELQNCSWDELRTVIDYLAGERERLIEDCERWSRMKVIRVPPTPQLNAVPWIWATIGLFTMLVWTLVLCGR